MKQLFTALFILTLALFLEACKSEQEKITERLEPVLTNLVLSSDSTLTKIDRLIIFDIDTLTDLSYAIRQAEIMHSSIDYHKFSAESNNRLAELYSSSAKSSLEQAKLYFNVLNSSDLGNIAKSEAASNLKKSNEYLSLSALHTDSIAYYSTLISQIKSKRRRGEIDSLAFRGYRPKFKAIGADKNGIEIKKDSLSAFVSTDYNIISVSIK